MNLDHEKGHHFKQKLTRSLTTITDCAMESVGRGGLAEGGVEMDFNHCTVFPRMSPTDSCDLIIMCVDESLSVGTDRNPAWQSWVRKGKGSRYICLKLGKRFIHQELHS